jgi:hypothetical protein
MSLKWKEVNEQLLLFHQILFLVENNLDEDEEVNRAKHLIKNKFLVSILEIFFLPFKYIYLVLGYKHWIWYEQSSLLSGIYK